MIGFLKRWFVTKNEIESVYSQLDTIAHAIQDIRKDQWIRAEAERGAIVKQPSEVIMSFERVDNLKPRKLPAKPVVVEGPDVVSKHIANAKIMIGKVGGHAEVRRLVKQGKLHAFLQAGPFTTNGKTYNGGKLTLYNLAVRMPSNAKRYSMVLRTAQEAKQVIQYFRSVGIPVKEEHK